MMSLTVNRLIRRKLRLSLILLVVYIGVDVADALNLFSGPAQEQLEAFGRLALAAAIINAIVFLLINPIRVDRVPERFPVILQDAIVIALLLLASTFLSQQLVTTSAVSAVVIGFALQDTLGNAFAGLAIQSERPFQVGHWVKVGEHEGRVADVTWRATKLRTRTGNLVVLPNNVVAKDPITNFSEPTAPSRLQVEVGASYLAPPSQVKTTLLSAIRHCSLVLPAPAPEVMLLSFDASSITYRAFFWIDNYERDEPALDQVRTAIYYAFQRHGIEIPYPIQVEYSLEPPPSNTEARVTAHERLLQETELFATLPQEVRREIASSAAGAVYGSGEAIVLQGDPGQSMFLVLSGEASVVLEPGHEEIARIKRGGYFGEMSLLTGEPRSATVLAVGDVAVMEVSADLFRRLATVHPEAIEKIGMTAIARRAELDQARTAASGAAAVAATTLMTRMKRFLRLK